MTDWRTLCEELLEAWTVELGELSEGNRLCKRARAAPAQPEPEVVEPTDEDCWQWYTYCPEEGIELYSNRQQAQSAAQGIMGSYEVAAHSDGWHEDMELVSWGALVPVEHAQVVVRGPADSGGEFDEWVQYELKAVARLGHPAPAPAGEVGELVAWLTEQAVQAADCEQPMAAGMLTWAAQVVGEHTELLEQRKAAPVPVLPEDAQVIEPTERTILVPVPLPGGKVES